MANAVSVCVCVGGPRKWARDSIHERSSRELVRDNAKLYGEMARCVSQGEEAQSGAYTSTGVGYGNGSAR